MFRDKESLATGVSWATTERIRGTKGILTFVSLFWRHVRGCHGVDFLNTGMCGDDVFWFDLRKGKFERFL